MERRHSPSSKPVSSRVGHLPSPNSGRDTRRPITREDFGTKVARRSPTKERFPPHSLPRFENRNSGGNLRVAPPGFQEALERASLNKLSADAPVFTPGGFGPSDTVPPTAKVSASTPRQSPHEVGHLDSRGRDDDKLWDQMLFMRKQRPSSFTGSKVNGSHGHNPRSSRARDEELVWNGGGRGGIPAAYQPPRIYPGLFPTNQRYASDIAFNEELYRSHEEKIWREKGAEAQRFGPHRLSGHGPQVAPQAHRPPVRKKAAETPVYENGGGYIDTTSNDNLEKHLNLGSMYEEDSLGLNYYASLRQGTPPNFFYQSATMKQKHRGNNGGVKPLHRHFDPDEFYKEELLPLHMRRDNTHAFKDPRVRNTNAHHDHRISHPRAPKSQSSGSSSPPKNQQQQSSVHTSNSSEATHAKSKTKAIDRERRAAPTNSARDMTGLRFARMSSEMLKYAKLHEKEIVDKLCHNELVYETEHYYIWKYMCHVLGVEISWPEADMLKTNEIITKAEKHVHNLKQQVHEKLKLEFVEDGIIVHEDYGTALDELVLNLERVMFSNMGKDPFEELKKATPDRRPKFKCDREKKESASEESESGADTPAAPDISKPENWAVMLPEDNVQFVMYDCDYCRERGLKSEGHWELNCYYYLTGCCPLCGSEEHISPYCTNPPSELTFHQSVMYVRQLAFYYGPPMLNYFPNIYHTLQSQFNDLVVWDPIQKRLVAQPIVTSEPVILWRHYDENGQVSSVPLMRNPFGGKSPLPSPMMSPSAICFDGEDKKGHAQMQMQKKGHAASPRNSPSLKRMKGDEEQLEEIVDLELDDLEDPFADMDIGEYDSPGVNDVFPDIPEFAETAVSYHEAEVLDASPVLHPLQQKSHERKLGSLKPTYESDGDSALMPYDTRRGLNPAEHIDLINARSVVPLTLPNTALDPIPFPNLPPAGRNELIRRIQSGEFASENLVYPIFPVPSTTMLIEIESPHPNGVENRV